MGPPGRGFWSSEALSLPLGPAKRRGVWAELRTPLPLGKWTTFLSLTLSLSLSLSLSLWPSLSSTTQNRPQRARSSTISGSAEDGQLPFNVYFNDRDVDRVTLLLNHINCVSACASPAGQK